uniref:Uncharacterized protein n=1 Tax=Aegilops tauschii subsp. strangulata TaxID=200361 RepID=A0A453T851_AEGTS
SVLIPYKSTGVSSLVDEDGQQQRRSTLLLDRGLKKIDRRIDGYLR